MLLHGTLRIQYCRTNRNEIITRFTNRLFTTTRIPYLVCNDTRVLIFIVFVYNSIFSSFNRVLSNPRADDTLCVKFYVKFVAYFFFYLKVDRSREREYTLNYPPRYSVRPKISV